MYGKLFDGFKQTGPSAESIQCPTNFTRKENKYEVTQINNNKINS
jgi:hypothetical protein